MNKLMYIVFEPILQDIYSGIRNKIYAQCRIFERYFEDVYCSVPMRERSYLIQNDGIVETLPSTIRKDHFDNCVEWIKKYNIEKVYLRHYGCNKWYIDLLKILKEKGIKAIIEIPTYPYDEEIAYGKRKLEDLYHREKIKQYVDAIATSSEFSSIWGINCISSFNGIDAKSYVFDNGSGDERDTHCIRMIAVAGLFCPWNGFERIIKGINEYYEKEHDYEILLTLIGTGGDELLYKGLVDQYGLEEKITFIPHLTKEELNSYYLNSDIGISTLAAYKKQIDCVSSLKTAEYCACGLPVVCGYRDLRFPIDWPYELSVPNDESVIDINEVIDFYNRISEIKDYKRIIHEYAIDKMSWESSLNGVIDYLLC